MRRVLLAATAVASIALAGAANASAETPGPSPDSRVVGGYFPSASFAPWVTSIQSSTGRCTASLIDPQRVLTAAHCVVDNLNPSDWTVRVGVRDRNDPAQGETRAVTGIAVHPQASLPSNGLHLNHAFYDLAVMFLDSPVSTTPAVVGTEADWNTVGTALGWGHYNLDHANPYFDPRLKALNMSMGDDEFCLRYTTGADGVQHYFPAIHACAYDYSGDDCITHGDSGGPLVVESGGVYKLIGVTSFFPSKSAWGPCGSISLTGFAWVAGPTLRSWPFSVANPTPPGPVFTGQRAEAIQRCKRLFRKGTKRRRKCIARANLLPL